MGREVRQLADPSGGERAAMKLLFVNASLTNGGSERAMTLLANQMAAFGHDVTMLLIRDKPRTYAVNDDVKLIQLTYRSTNKVAMLFERLQLVRQHAKELNSDCIVSFMWDVNVMTLAATLGLHTRKVVSERAFPGSSERTRMSKILQWVFYGAADAIVYQTEMARDYCPRRLKSRSHVIPNIVNRPDVEPFKGGRAKKIVSVGRLNEQKNYPMLLRAFSKFVASHTDYRLEIYGDGGLKNSLIKLSAELGVSDSVSFMGYVDDVAERINNASMFALSSNFEGISNAMTEAMSLGLAVICTDCPAGGAALMIEDGQNGLLVPVGDVDSLTDAMCRVADDPAFARRLGEQAKKSVEGYSAERIGHIWEKVFYAG